MLAPFISTANYEDMWAFSSLLALTGNYLSANTGHLAFVSFLQPTHCMRTGTNQVLIKCFNRKLKKQIFKFQSNNNKWQYHTYKGAYTNSLVNYLLLMLQVVVFKSVFTSATSWGSRKTLSRLLKYMQQSWLQKHACNLMTTAYPRLNNWPVVSWTWVTHFLCRVSLPEPSAFPRVFWADSC